MSALDCEEDEDPMTRQKKKERKKGAEKTAG